MDLSSHLTCMTFFFLGIPYTSCDLLLEKGSNFYNARDDVTFSTNLAYPFRFFGTNYSKIYFYHYIFSEPLSTHPTKVYDYTPNGGRQMWERISAWVGDLTWDPDENGVISLDREFRNYYPYASLRYHYPPIICALHTDLDGHGKKIYTRESTTFVDVQKANSYVDELFPSLVPYNSTSVVIVTWNDIPAYGQPEQLTNTFQAVLVNHPTHNFVILLYDRITMTNYNPVVGVSAGDGVESEEHPISGNRYLILRLDDSVQATTTGLIGFYVERDIDECNEQKVCSDNALCYNSQERYFCQCQNGFTETGFTCEDIDECNQYEPCGEYGECKNTPGSFSCTCNPGFEGNGLVCIEIDECLSDDDNECDENAVCMNEIGTYKCHCRIGFRGDGFDCERICITSCVGLIDRDYQSCIGCNVYVNCHNGSFLDNKRCPPGNLVWDDDVKECVSFSNTCASEDTNTRCVDSCSDLYDGDYKACNSCDEYVSCVNRTLYHRVCPRGTQWNNLLRMCDYPYRAGCVI